MTPATNGRRLRAVLYGRVSSQEQVQGYSLDAQDRAGTTTPTRTVGTSSARTAMRATRHGTTILPNDPTLPGWLPTRKRVCSIL
jgi:hypothetical protein